MAKNIHASTPNGIAAKLLPLKLTVIGGLLQFPSPMAARWRSGKRARSSVG